MYKKILFFLILSLFAAGCTSGVTDFCSSEFDGTRTIVQDRDCLVVVRDSFEQLQADVNYVLLNPDLFFEQPVNPNINFWELFQPVNPN